MEEIKLQRHIDIQFADKYKTLDSLQPTIQRFTTIYLTYWNIYDDVCS